MSASTPLSFLIQVIRLGSTAVHWRHHHLCYLQIAFSSQQTSHFACTAKHVISVTFFSDAALLFKAYCVATLYSEASIYPIFYIFIS